MIDGRRFYAHRLMCEHHFGAAPSPHHEAAHSCGNQWCVSPKHLRWATGVENAADRVLHGTDFRGERHPNVKLTREQIIDIRLASMSIKELAAKHGISRSYAAMVRRGAAWAWLEVGNG